MPPNGGKLQAITDNIAYNIKMKTDINCIWSVVQKGVPTFLDGVLAEKFDIHNPQPPMNYT